MRTIENHAFHPRKLQDIYSGTVAPVPAAPREKQTAPDAAETTKVALSSLSVAISRSSQAVDDGYSTMLQRLFHVTERSKEPKVETMATMENMFGNDKAFLTHEDRRFLARAYHYTKQEGLDPYDVDMLAFDLSHFRFLQATGNNIESKPGAQWATDGTPQYWRMTQSDSDVANRLLTSTAAATTSLDHGFIAFVLNPRGGGWSAAHNVGHACNFTFLEKLINASGAHTLLKVDPDHPEPLYQNSLHWIRHQDIPDLPPPAREVDTASTGIDSAMFRNQLQANSESSPDYVAQAMALRKLHQNAPTPGATRAERKATYRARILERQQTVSSLLRDFITARLGSF